ncbi:hypothetical protein [Paraburkholderia terrae]|uniref:hypothetical protein n=1 Tax=Paraburkholderia terrae TaxID=311230 RepID=UPI001EE23D4C|nr:hypothetical protein [Paraburkholderia terrae]GJH04996.1 hypothetical protein CBA19C8_30585 [Paraburkholderia terrae]
MYEYARAALAAATPSAPAVAPDALTDTWLESARFDASEAIDDRDGELTGCLDWCRAFAEIVLRHSTALSGKSEAAAGEPVAWRIEHRPGRYTFTEHEENLKLDAGANIVPLYRAFHSVDAILESTLDRLESMVTWEPRLLAGPDAIDRLEHINRLLYELLNPHPTAPPAASGQKLTGEQIAALRVAADALIERYADPIRAILRNAERVEGLTVQRLRTLMMRHAKSYSEWDSGSIERIDFGQYGFDEFARALLRASDSATASDKEGA